MTTRGDTTSVRRQALTTMIVLAMVAFAGWFVLPYLLYWGPDWAHRSDAEMTRIFMTRQRDFDRLLAMFEADSAVDVVWAPAVSFTPQLPRERQGEYERLMTPLHIVQLEREGHDVVLFRSTTTHTFDRKGWLWSRAPAIGESVPWLSKRRLAPHWYIYEK